MNSRKPTPPASPPQEPDLPDGWITGLHEPTEEMIEAYFARVHELGFHACINATAAWLAFRSAAPQPPGGEAGEDQLSKALRERDEARRAVIKCKDLVLGIADRIEEEGDRTYFGSTNDPQILIGLGREIDALHWTFVPPSPLPALDHGVVREAFRAGFRAGEAACAWVNELCALAEPAPATGVTVDEALALYASESEGGL